MAVISLTSLETRPRFNTKTIFCVSPFPIIKIKASTLYTGNPYIGNSSLYSWWRHLMEDFPRYWSFVRGIHRSPVNSPHKGQWRGSLMFSLICTWINGWVNNREAGDLRSHRANYDVIVMWNRSWNWIDEYEWTWIYYSLFLIEW